MIELATSVEFPRADAAGNRSIEGVRPMSQNGSETIRTKILRYLEVYGTISPSMLHTGIGPAIPADVWRPVLKELIAEGLVIEASTQAHGRSYPVVRLNKKPSEPILKTV